MITKPPPIRQDIALNIIDTINQLDRFAMPAWGASLAGAMAPAKMPDGAMQLGGAKLQVKTDKHEGWLVIRAMADGTYRVEIGDVDETEKRKPRWRKATGFEDVAKSELVHFIDYLIN